MTRPLVPKEQQDSIQSDVTVMHILPDAAIHTLQTLDPERLARILGFFFLHFFFYIFQLFSSES